MHYLQRRVRVFLVVVLAAIALSLVPQATATQAGQSVRIDKSTPYGVVANLALNVRNDEHTAMVELIRESDAQWHHE